MRIAIACGDPCGVGPEVTLKAVAQHRADPHGQPCTFRLFGDPAQLNALNRQLGLQLPLASEAGSPAPIVVTPAGVVLHGEGQDLKPGSRDAALAAMRWLESGARACLDGTADALVTAPVSKEAIINAGHPAFVGQTEHLSAMAGTDQTIMMLLGADDRGRWLRVALATIHLALRRVPDALTAAGIQLAIRRAVGACRDLGLPRARVAVCGLNPHAGEGGKMGTEELSLIGPAVEAMRREFPDVTGPLPADTVFHHAFKGEFDAVVAMYHDQGLGPLKMVAFESGINWTLGLPFIRTSPDHGTAFDIAGRGVAHAGSMLSALRLAIQLASERNPR